MKRTQRVRLTLRISTHLKRWLEKKAKDEGRSLNQFLEVHLVKLGK